jgi:hypothetical protein
VFSMRDMEYVTSSAPADVRELFLRERRKLASSWVCQVHKGVRTLKSFHLGQARFHERLSLRTEVELALTFAILLSACRLLQLALHLGGPYAAPVIMKKTTEAIARLCVVSEKSMEFISPAGTEAFTRGSASGNSAL